MPKTDSITLLPIDIKNIMEQLEEKKWSGGYVTVKDCGEKFQLEDKDGMNIGSVNKCEY